MSMTPSSGFSENLQIWNPQKFSGQTLLGMLLWVLRASYWYLLLISYFIKNSILRIFPPGLPSLRVLSVRKKILLNISFYSRFEARLFLYFHILSTFAKAQL